MCALSAACSLELRWSHASLRWCTEIYWTWSPIRLCHPFGSYTQKLFLIPGKLLVIPVPFCKTYKFFTKTVFVCLIHLFHPSKEYSSMSFYTTTVKLKNQYQITCCWSRLLYHPLTVSSSWRNSSAILRTLTLVSVISRTCCTHTPNSTFSLHQSSVKENSGFHLILIKVFVSIDSLSRIVKYEACNAFQFHECLFPLSGGEWVQIQAWCPRRLHSRIDIQQVVWRKESKLDRYLNKERNWEN